MSKSNLAIRSDWFQRSSLAVAPDLIGCTLVRQWPSGEQRRGVIVETEAYAPDDPACHAYRRQTPRNAVMFGPGGKSYVYLIYGMYHCFNVVTDGDQVPSAVLIRALDLDMLPLPHPKFSPKAQHRAAAGPGKLCRLFEIDRTLNGIDLAESQPLWLEHRQPEIQMWLNQSPEAIVQTTRIGISQGVELPWRWYLSDSRAVSKR